MNTHSYSNKRSAINIYMSTYNRLGIFSTPDYVIMPAYANKTLA